MRRMKYPIVLPIAWASVMQISLVACSTSRGFDDDAINQRAVYREDESTDALPTPQQAAEEARQDRAEEEKRIAERKQGDETLAVADSDGTLDDLTAAYARILVPDAQAEQPYFAPVKKTAKDAMAAAMTGTLKTGGTTRRKPVFLGKFGVEAILKQASRVDLNAPAAVTGGIMSLSARSSRSAGPISNGENLASYIVRPGDSLSTISMHIYGTASRWMEIAHLNRLGNGSVIFPNELILYVPDRGAKTP